MDRHNQRNVTLNKQSSLVVNAVLQALAAGMANRR
jgi:hypothetical protein